MFLQYKQNLTCDLAENKLSENLDKNTIILSLSESAKKIFTEIYLLHTVDSTMLEARRLLQSTEKSCNGTVIIAEHQSAGKGRLGRTFYSPKSTGIYMTFILDASNYSSENSSPVGITVASAVAIHRAFEKFGIDAKIKWVNDLFIENKKVCGILTEGVFSKNPTNGSIFDTFIVGIGINVSKSEEDFPEELKDIATVLPKNIERTELIAEVLNALTEVFNQKNQEVVLDEYKKYSLVIGKEVNVIKPNETYPAKVLEITNEAHLLIELPDGTQEELLSGEVSIRF